MKWRGKNIGLLALSVVLCVPTFPTAPAGEDPDGEWFQTCRPHLEWVNWDPNVDIEGYADELVARARAIQSDTLVYPWESGGYALYPTELAPPYEPLRGRDLLGTLERKAHAAGLRFVVCFLGLSANTYLTEAKREWVQRDARSELIRQWPGYLFRSLCPNSPYSDYLYDVAAELLRRYRIDGFYLEGIYMSSGMCHCAYCQDYFRRTYHRDVPRENLDTDLEYQRYRQDSFVRPFQALRRAIQEVSPQTALFGNIGHIYSFGRQGDDIGRVAPLSDVVSIEAQWNYDLPQGFNPISAPQLHEVGMIMRQIRARSGKPMLGTVWIGKHVDQNYAPRTPAHVRLNFVELLAQGAIPQVHTQNGLEVDPLHIATLTRLYGDAAKLLPWLAGSEPLAHVGLLDWATLDHPAEFSDRSLRGAYKAMLEAQLPVTFVTPTQLAAGKADVNVLVVANARRLDDATIESLARFARDGGGLVMTYQTIVHQPRLAELAGVRHLASHRKAEGEFPLHTYYRLESEEGAWGMLRETLRSFQGDYEEVEPLAGTRVVGHVLDFDLSRRSDKHILTVTWPGQPIAPLATERTVGRGKVVYLAPDLCAAARRFGDADTLAVLATAVRAASDRLPPLRVLNSPPSVEVVPYRGPRGVAIVLVNQTTNQYLSDPIRYVVPIRDLELRLSNAGTGKAKVMSLSGQRLEIQKAGEELRVRLPILAEYDAVFVSR
jgi:hypothetical protein